MAPAGKSNAVVMGRKCWESIPANHRPLKDRINVIISSQSDYDLGGAGGCILVPSLREGLSALSKLDKEKEDSATGNNDNNTTSRLHRTFIIGGGRIYKESLSYPETNRILITRISEPDFDCDVFFPEFQRSVDSGSDRDTEDPGKWKMSDHESLVEWAGVEVPPGVQEDKGIKYEFQMWVRDSQ